MDITFASRKLEKQLNSQKEMLKAHGKARSKHLMRLLTQLHAAPTLEMFAPPYSPPHRCHELKGNRKHQLSLDLDGPYRLIFKPNHMPTPTKPDGGLDWQKVTSIEIKAIENTHGK